MATTLTATSTDPKSFIHMSQTELDDMFTRANTGPIPVGNTNGTAIFKPGTPIATLAWAFVKALVWRGKVFSPATQDLKNKLTPFSILGIRANVYLGQSWLDGKGVIVIDYSKTSFVARKIRDEIREVAPGVYLGKVWWGKSRVADFALRT
jgi:hypothetical protein